MVFKVFPSPCGVLVLKLIGVFANVDGVIVSVPLRGSGS